MIARTNVRVASSWVVFPMSATRDRVVETQDTGIHTNPRKYEKDHGFVSALAVCVVPTVAVQAWAVGLAAVNPLIGRTAGKLTTVYEVSISNPTGGPIIAVFMSAALVPLTVPYPLLAGESLVVDWTAGLNVGNLDIWFFSDTAGVFAQVLGTEDVV